MNAQDLWISSLLLVVSIALYACGTMLRMDGVEYGTLAMMLASVGGGSAGYKLWSGFCVRKT